MNAFVHAVSPDNPESRGKSIDFHNVAISVKAFTPSFPDQPVVHIETTATIVRGTGDRGGEARAVNRSLSISLTQIELKMVFEAAAAVGIFPVPGMVELHAAYESLSNCVQKLGLMSLSLSDRARTVPPISQPLGLVDSPTLSRIKSTEPGNSRGRIGIGIARPSDYSGDPTRYRPLRP